MIFVAFVRASKTCLIYEFRLPNWTFKHKKWNMPSSIKFAKASVLFFPSVRFRNLPHTPLRCNFNKSLKSCSLQFYLLFEFLPEDCWGKIAFINFCCCWGWFTDDGSLIFGNFVKLMRAWKFLNHLLRDRTLRSAISHFIPDTLCMFLRVFANRLLRRSSWIKIIFQISFCMISVLYSTFMACKLWVGPKAVMLTYTTDKNGWK